MPNSSDSVGQNQAQPAARQFDAFHERLINGGDAFDPYYVWLGIPPDEQPPSRYRLLGLRPFESNLDVISNAADRQTAHVRTIRSSEHLAVAQRILNEISAARVCLLNAEKKADYDQQLRAELQAAQQAAPSYEGIPAAQAARQVVAERPANQPFLSSRGLAIFAAVFGVLVIVAVAAIFFGSSSQPVLAFDWPAGERESATMQVDGKDVSVPDSGPWEVRVAPGEHRLTGRRPSYWFDTTVTVGEGQRQTIEPGWRATFAKSDDAKTADDKQSESKSSTSDVAKPDSASLTNIPKGDTPTTPPANFKPIKSNPMEGKPGPPIISAKFGEGDNWVDVTNRVAEVSRPGNWVHATAEFLQVSPTPGKRRTLVIVYLNSPKGKRQTSNVQEGDIWKPHEHLK